MPTSSQCTGCGCSNRRWSSLQHIRHDHHNVGSFAFVPHNSSLFQVCPQSGWCPHPLSNFLNKVTSDDLQSRPKHGAKLPSLKIHRSRRWCRYQKVLVCYRSPRATKNWVQDFDTSDVFSDFSFSFVLHRDPGCLINVELHFDWQQIQPEYTSDVVVYIHVAFRNVLVHQ